MRNIRFFCFTTYKLRPQSNSGETVSIHAVRERPAGFSNVKSFAYITLELVDNVHRLAVSMGSYGVSEVGK